MVQRLMILFLLLSLSFYASGQHAVMTGNLNRSESLSTSNPGDADYPFPRPSARHNQKVAAIKSGSFDLFMIGNSITQTLSDSDGEWEPLKAVWNRHFAPRNAINLGYSGYRTEDILWNLQNGELDQEKSPKVAVLLIGTNNLDDQHYKTIHTAEQVFAGTKAIVELIKQRHPTTKILILRIFTCGGPDDQTAYHRKYNRSAGAMEEVRRAGELTAQLADNRQVFWLDVNHVFLRSDGTINTDLMPDLIHPNAAGAEAWVQAMEPTLAKLMGDKPIIDPPANELSKADTPVKEIIVVCKTHFDIGYTHRVNEIVQYYRTSMIDNALNIMESSKNMPKEQQFAWTAPGWVMSKVLDDWPGQSPQRRDQLDHAFQSGKFLTHAMPFTLESDACEPEEMARGLIFASQLSRKYDLPLPLSCKVTDVPSHTGALATVLSNAGVKFIHIGCNWPSGYVKTPGLFWWEGPDGSRILTFYSSIYGTCYGLYPKAWTSTTDPLVGENLLPAKDWPYKVWPAILVTPDNSGPPKAEQVKAMFEEVAEKLPGVKVRMGTMDDFVNAILAENPRLPVVKNEMPDTWIHGVMCDPGGIRMSREVHPLLASAEAMNTQLHYWGVKTPSVSQSVALAYEKMLLYGEHTWGGAQAVNVYGEDFKKLPAAKYADLEASWEDKTAYIREASKLAHEMADSNMLMLARSVKHAKPGIIVYNPLPWTRSGIVEINGKHFFANDIPPCGYRTFPLSSADEEPSPVAAEYIENEFFKITFNPARGSITSLIDKRTGREWVDTNAEHGLGQYLNERFTFEQTLKYAVDYQQGRALNSFGTKGEWPHPGMHKPGMISEKVVPYRAAVSANGSLKISAGRKSQTALLEMPGDPSNHMPASILKVTLFKNQPWIDLQITIKDKAKDNWPEADWLCLPFKVTSPEFQVYRPLGRMNPATDIQPGANRHLYSVGHGVTIAEADGSGIAICPVDHPLVSLDTPGCWKFSNNFIPKKPVVYLNLYNNQWNTNFRYWYPGTWSSAIRIRTFDKNTAPDAIIATPALEARNPLQAVLTQGKGGSLPAVKSGLTLSRKGVLVTAFGADPDGNQGTLLRVWEQAGISSKITVTLPAEMKENAAIPVNLRGERQGEAIKISSHQFEFNLAAFAPGSFILKTN